MPDVAASQALRVLVAPDSFKSTATARAAAEAISAGWSSVRPDDTVEIIPMADGGEGTLDAFATAVPNAVRMPITVRGPDHRQVDSSWLLLPDSARNRGTIPSQGVGIADRATTAIVELASTSGLGLLDAPLPLDAHTYGFGQAIGAALDYGVNKLLLAIGGSASTDGGVGALSALGAGFLDAARRPIRLGNRAIGSLHSVDLTGLRPLPPGGAVILSDVTNPLLGSAGAARVFGQQKGASPAQVAGLESNLTRLARLLPVDPRVPGAGAAGGAGFGLLAWGATMATGAEAVGSALGLPEAVRKADIVITGEGSFDSQTAAGKVASYVVGLSQASATPCLLVAGRIEAEPFAFDEVVSLTELAGSEARATAESIKFLRDAGRALAASLGSAT